MEFHCLLVQDFDIDNLSKARLKFLCKIKAVVVEILDKK